MATMNRTLRYPLSMSVVIAGVSAMVLSFLLDLLLGVGIIAGILGIWGMVIATIGVIAVAVIWLLGQSE